MTRWALIVCLLSSTLGGCALRSTSVHTVAERPAEAGGESAQHISPVERATAPARAPRPAAAARLEEHDPGLLELHAAVQLAPTAERHRRLAEAYVRHGVRDAAYDHFTAAIKLSKKDGPSYEGRARLWRDWGLPQMGIGDAHRAIHFSKDRAGPYNTLGTLLVKMGRLVEARKAFGQALALSPRADYALNNLCYVNLLEGRISDAVDVCREALAIAPASKTARNNLALAYTAAGDSRAAYREFAHAGDVAAASYNMGIAFASIGNLPEAARAFGTAWRIDPRMTDARDRARLLAARTSGAVG